MSVTTAATVWEALRTAEERGITAGQVAAAIETLANQDEAQRLIGLLTSREREVLGHLAGGMANAAIAHAMSLSEGCVKAHVSRMLTKLRCDNRVQAALLARDAGPWEAA